MGNETGLRENARGKIALRPSERKKKSGKSKNVKWPKLPTTVVKSAGRTLQVLEYFDFVQRPASAVEISGALGYPQSSTCMLLHSLESLGYLVYDCRKRTYFPSDRVRLLGDWISPSSFRHGQFQELMRKLSKLSGARSVLAVRRGLHVQYIYSVQPGRWAPPIVPGTLLPLVVSTVGRIILSTLPDDEVAGIIRRSINEGICLDRPPSPKELLSRIRRIREDGFYVSLNQVWQGVGMVAMPLPGNHEPSTAFGLSGDSQFIEQRHPELIQMMRTEMFNHYQRFSQGGEAGLSALSTQ